MSTTLRPALRVTRPLLGWHAARSVARDSAVRAVATDIVPLSAAGGRTLAHDLFALTDLPHYSSSAMDGWAVCGDGPWEIGEPIRAGASTALAPLAAGVARPIATGAPVPPGTTAIVRREQGDTRWTSDGMRLELCDPAFPPQPGRDLRHRGEEARHGEPLLLAGTTLTAPRLALAAVAGYDEVSVLVAPRVDLVLLGDELRMTGLPADGRVRDAFLPSLPAAVASAGGARGTVVVGRDTLDATVEALSAATAPLVLTTGGTALGPADFVRSALDAMGAELIIDGVAMRPGHPVILARLASGRLLLALPGNPLAAMLAFASVGVPVLDGILGRDRGSAARVPLAVAVENASASTRLVPCALGPDGATPTPWQDSGMLRGLASADLVAVVPPGGSGAGSVVETLPLPW